jgi:hypothetical protein
VSKGVSRNAHWVDTSTVLRDEFSRVSPIEGSIL